MDDTVDALKKYWPWAVGLVGIIFLYPRLAGGGSDNSGAVVTGPMYDPNVLASQNALNAQSIQASAAIAGKEIEANAMIGMAEYAAIGQAFGAMASINNANVMGNVASYQAYKDISVAGVSNAADVAQQGLMSAGQTTLAFANTVSSIGVNTANMVNSVAMAGAQTDAARYRAEADAFKSFMSWGAN